ncbi:hypothetical protein GA0074692_2354 [Micromonospora pallida]|uniref:Uncharacterized protein n=1 Tax=Micromonospora pallida TaxID=145854 RepID=A0A1C6SDJ1_9ACTN|nr:hypothetical protein [Micromonospora pallida]SCL27463.1 hypothetical protein GA0074692_2354 [Micromonospora pallida]
MAADSAKGAGSDGNGLAVLLEFSASDPSQSISSALGGSLPVPTVELDLIGVDYGREADLDRRAALVAAEVAATGAGRVALAASCAASPMLAPVARQLTRCGVSVTLAAAVDPRPVTDGHIRETLAQVADRFGVADGRTSAAGLDLAGPVEVVLGRIEAMLGDWVEGFLRSSDLDPETHELVRLDLVDRYLRWNSFLLAALDAPAQHLPCRVDVFLTDPSSDVVALFGPDTTVRRHRYPRRDSPALDRDDLLDDLRTALTAGVATG